jgi:hypothetical protein
MASTLGSAPAEAQSVRSIGTTGRMALLGDSVCAIEARSTLACHPTQAAGDWTEVIGESGEPTSVLLDQQTGVVRVLPARSTGNRVLLVSRVPNTQLWERTDPVAGTAACWTPLGAPPGIRLLRNSPSIAATSANHTVVVGHGPCPHGRPGTCAVTEKRRQVIVAVRTSDLGADRLWIARYDPRNNCSAAPPHVDWLDASSLDGTGQSLAADNSDVAIVRGLGVTLAFLITPRGTVRAFDVDNHRWSNVGPQGAPVHVSSPIARTQWNVSAGAIQAVLYPSPAELRVFVGAHAPGQASDDIFMARSTDGAAWGWTDLVMGAVTPSTPFRNSLATDLRATSAFPGVEQVLFTAEINGDRLLFCRVPPVGPVPTGPSFNVEECVAPTAFRMAHPSDMAPVAGIAAAGISPGRDVIGPAIVAEILPDPGWLCDQQGCGCDASGACAQAAPSGYRVFVPGDIAGTGYLYQMEAVTLAGQGTLAAQPIWYNLLSPSARSASLPTSPSSQEFTADELFGAVAITDTVSQIWRSDDDGNTWSGAINPWGPASLPVPGLLNVGSDTNLGIDPTGTLYLTEMADYGPIRPISGGAVVTGINSIAIVSSGEAAASPINPPLVIPATFNNVSDRPWMVVRHDSPNSIVLSWRTTDASGLGAGALAYCAAGADCGTNVGAWCPRQLLPITNGVVGRPFLFADNLGPFTDCGSGGSCFMAQAGDGEIWVAAGDDRDCAAACGSQRSFGLRRITNREQLGPSCVAPTFSSPPECVCYPGDASRPDQQASCAGGGGDGGWNGRLAAATDDGGIALTVRAYVDSDAAGKPCGEASTHCREDVRLVRRDVVHGTWCGVSTCVQPILPAPAIFVDSTFTVNALSMSQTDHDLPQLWYGDYGQVAVHWMDFDAYGPTDLQYDWRVRSARFLGRGLVRSVSPISRPWPSGSVPALFFRNTPCDNSVYGDVDVPAAARLHTHTVHTFYGVSGGALTDTVLTIRSSPRVPPL